MELSNFDWMAIDRNEGLRVSDVGSGVGTKFESTPLSRTCVCNN
jgi:hypothetical protein